MRVVRLYRCVQCGTKFRRTLPFGAPEPPCPTCLHEPPPIPQRIAAPAITGTKAKAIDIAWDIANKDYGLTDMNDRLREGDTAYKPPPERPANAPIVRPEMMWGGASGSSAGGVGQEALLQGARQSASIATAEGRNPLSMLHDKKPKLVAKPVNNG